MGLIEPRQQQVTTMSARVFTKETLLRGQPAQIECIDVGGQTFSVTRGLVSVVTLEDEWFQEVRDPAAVIATLREDRALGGDIFSFCQRLPHTEVQFPYHCEFESIAAIQVSTYDQWFTTQIEKTTRNQIRKSQKAGVDARECAYDDAFVRGMTSIFNETPIRQGRKFWHYGKDFNTVKQQFSRNLFREELIGAYFQGELIGFAMLGKTGHYADLGQIISKIAHRDKSVTNALIAKAVEMCCARQIPYLVYGFWTEDSLGQFKRHFGFGEVKLPRYYVPLTLKGRMAMRTNAHRGLRTLLPASLVDSLKRARSNWYRRQEQRRSVTSE
jgi:hypothetical protein